MVLSRIASAAPALRRGFVTSALKQSGHHDYGGIPGSNLPFGITNRYRLTALFIVFFGSGLGLPFIMVRHQLLKQ